MPLIPAFCDNCGAAFSSGFFLDNCTNITLSGNKSGPCPRCGGMGSVPDGVFNVIGGVIEQIGVIRSKTETLNKVVAILNSAAETKVSSQQLAQSIRKETPELSSLADVLPKTRVELYAFITLLLAIIAFVISQSDDDFDAQDLLERALDRSMQPQYYIPYGNPKVETRNSVCTCGSGNRYKHCCGKMI